MSRAVNGRPVRKDGDGRRDDGEDVVNLGSPLAGEGMVFGRQYWQWAISRLV